MKTYAYHDESGSIKSIVTFNAPEGHALFLATAPGTFVSAIEKIKFKSETPEFSELSELARGHKIATSKSPATLVKK